MSRICLVHDWLTGMRGGEKVLEAIAESYPNAPIYTLICNRKKLSPSLASRNIKTSFLQWIPGVFLFYRWLLPIFPFAIQTFNLKGCDLIISSSHCVAKGIRVPKGGKHVCYCHSPMRYLWDMQEEYFGKYPKFLRWGINFIFRRMRKWDVKTSQNVDLFIANSSHIAQKIQRIYGKEAVVVHPPVELPPEKTDANTPSPFPSPFLPEDGSVQRHLAEGRGECEGYYLIVSSLVPYKRVDLAVEAFNQLEKDLVIIGDGPLRNKLERLSEGKRIQFKGWLDSNQLWNYYKHAKALIFPGEEDFGIVPVESQMCGVPVIAYGRGGILDSVIPYVSSGESTGIFFESQTVDALKNAVNLFESIKFDKEIIRQHAYKFNRNRFQNEIHQCLKKFKN